MLKKPLVIRAKPVHITTVMPPSIGLDNKIKEKTIPTTPITVKYPQSEKPYSFNSNEWLTALMERNNTKKPT